MMLAIADPPYLGRAGLWYGGKGRSKQGTQGRACGRGKLAAEYHPNASEWDNPSRHIDTLRQIDNDYDGWAYAASAKTIDMILPTAFQLGARLAVWQVTNAIPDGARVMSTWEAVLFKQPRSRRAVGTGMRVKDVLTCAHPVSGFVGAKPREWTNWVLDLLGYQINEDEVFDLFPGSGAVQQALDGRII